MDGLRMFKRDSLKRSFQSIIIFLMPFTTLNAYASAPSWTKCDDIESIAGTDDDKPKIKVGLLHDFEGMSYVLIDAILETPSSGYDYQVTLEGVENDTQNIRLKLLAPEMGASVIDKISIMERLETSQSFKKANINIEKSFNWGPEVISCSFEP